MKHIKLPRTINWLYEENHDYDEFPPLIEEFYCENDEVLKVELEKRTLGCVQFWAHINEDHHGNETSYLEYHNGEEKWNQEIYFNVENIYINESFLQVVKKMI